MAKEIKYITKMQNVKGKIIQAKSNDNGYWSYLLGVKNPSNDEIKYLYKGKTGYSIWLKGTKEQTRSEGEDVTLAELGIEEYKKNDGSVGYCGHNIAPPVFEGTKKEEPKPTETVSTEKKDPIQEMWDSKEVRGHLRALTATILASCFAPRTNEDGIEPMDRMTCALDLAEIALERIYNVSKKI